MRPFTVVVATVLFAVGCGDNRALPPDAAVHECSDGVDNDNDGATDFPADLGCDSELDGSEDSVIKPACNDKRDNDGDGKIDYPNDPGCPALEADSEADDCPGGRGCPECGDAVDNDGNGQTDFPADPGCNSASDDIEILDPSAMCGESLTIKDLPTNGRDIDTLTPTSTSALSSACNTGGGRRAIAYRFELLVPRVLVASTDNTLTAIDTILDLRSSTCAPPTAHIACNDNVATGNTRSTIVRPLQPGTYYLIVEGKTPTTTGRYGLTVDFRAAQGEPCFLPSDCPPGLLCRIPAGGTQRVCLPPVCNDTLDDDGDGKADYPADPGCTAPDDATENDVCPTAPTDPACPQCGNGIDDDNDGAIDYPNDTTCIAASTLREACTQSEPVIVATAPQIMGTTAGAINDFRPPPGSYNGHACSTTGAHSAPDVVVQLDVPRLTSLSLKLNPVGFDSSFSLLNASCSGMPIDCYRTPINMVPSNMVRSNLAAGRYYVVVDGYTAESGTFTLNISGTIADGESCESPLAAPGGLACGPGRACKGAPGSRVCVPAECNDGVDNNSDGRTDYPADPGCESRSDDLEETVCPGANCPVCADGIDNDGDTLIDYPTDTGCVAASAGDEGCAEAEPILPITRPDTNGTLVTATHTHVPSCVTGNFPDRIFTLDVPVTLQSLRIDTTGSAVDTVLSFMTRTCSEPSIACDDNGGPGTTDSLITRGFVTPGLYTIAVDAKTATLDTFIINVSGVIIPGGSCESQLFQDGVLACSPGFGCNGAPGSRRCTASQCFDGIDNNGDGRIDYPNDPGCDSNSDNAEETVCPGPSCPACGDGADNDFDGATDYPADTTCNAASGRSEGCGDRDPITVIAAATTTGTLVGASDDHDPLCVTTTGVDKIFTLAVPALESLRIDTEGSVVDTVLSLMNSSCEEPSIACDNDGGDGSLDSLITRGFVQAGVYTIAVDANSATANTFNLNVFGVIVPGESCESPLVDAGALICSTGFTCGGPLGARTCVMAECLDGFDNNGDGLVDFPDDPGCDSFSDAMEDTLCPGPACPVCSDGIDNDGDALIDFPDDPSCFSASAVTEACTQTEPIRVITERIMTGTTIGQNNDYRPTCGSATTHTAPDVALQLVVPRMATLSLNLFSNVSTAHELLNATCGGTEVACSTADNMALTDVAGGTYYLVVDGLSTGSGPWTLTTTGTVAPGQSCEGALFQSGAFTCTAGHACGGGPVGMRICVISQCNDGLDNNGDGAIDYPFDAGCESPDDDTETTVCPGAGCPACRNTADDDGDTLVDFPGDFGCRAAGGTTEAFCAVETSPAAVITMPQTAGSLAAPATDDYEQTCQTSTGNDLAYALQLPVPVARLVVDTLGSTTSDTVLSVWDANCGAQLGCDDDSAPGTNLRSVLTLTGVRPGNYAIQVDSFGTSNNGSFLLNVKGTVAPGTTCTSPLFATGVLACSTGYVCGGPAGAQTCVPSRCNDGLDNNGDGPIDYPFDPGCASPSDDDEATVCPGTACPVCSNAGDDDGDMRVDFPADFGCAGAGSTSEAFCPAETTPPIVITMPQTAGTLVAPATGNYGQTCTNSSTGIDLAYALQLPVPVATLVVDTLGSAITNTIVSVWDANCSVQLGCDDDGAPGTDLRSVLTLTDVLPGNYAIQVDNSSTTTTINAFFLNVKGTVAPGTACTSPLFASGVLACPAGTTCTAGTCQ